MFLKLSMNTVQVHLIIGIIHIFAILVNGKIQNESVLLCGIR